MSRPTVYASAYRVLKSVFEDGAYLGDALGEQIDGTEERSKLTFVVYGVLDRAIELDYLIDRSCKNPKPAARLILRMGTFLGKYSQMPDYAVVSETVELCRELGKDGLCGFVNATLKNILNSKPEFPSDERKMLSIKYSFPLWIVQKYLRQYGNDAETLLSFHAKSFEHVRLRCERTPFSRMLVDREIPFEQSSEGDALWVDYGKLIASDIRKDSYTKMNYGSMMVCKLVHELPKTAKILDVCAAPGGKSCYLADLFPNAEVTACDIHPHRLDLIRSYSRRLKLSNVSPRLCDATVEVPEFAEAFDLVLADVPCSGLGIVYSKPDIKLNRFPEDIPALAETQEKILETVCRYVKLGGFLIYSTCTTLREENEDVVFRFLRDHPEFVKLTEQKLNPIVGNCEGFYMVKLGRKG